MTLWCVLAGDSPVSPNTLIPTLHTGWVALCCPHVPICLRFPCSSKIWVLEVSTFNVLKLRLPINQHYYSCWIYNVVGVNMCADFQWPFTLPDFMLLCGGICIYQAFYLTPTYLRACLQTVSESVGMKLYTYCEGVLGREGVTKLLYLTLHSCITSSIVRGEWSWEAF